MDRVLVVRPEMKIQHSCAGLARHCFFFVHERRHPETSAQSAELRFGASVPISSLQTPSYDAATAPPASLFRNSFALQTQPSSYTIVAAFHDVFSRNSLPPCTMSLSASLNAAGDGSEYFELVKWLERSRTGHAFSDARERGRVAGASESRGSRASVGEILRRSRARHVLEVCYWCSSSDGASITVGPPPRLCSR
uniref:Uncharacterized protein n=1 Tax=Mycena chlorophos TaxID=658473 RepID=A0ABQ0LU97_MYCCL|nr:predicted protein [Mycena chlorophos]